MANLDSSELRILLHERIGGLGQTDIARSGPNKFCLPSARDSCRVVFIFKGKKIVAIQPGKAFDATQWEEIRNEIEDSILAGPTKFGREYSFSGRRVTASWRGEHSGVQILPPPIGRRLNPLSSCRLLSHGADDSIRDRVLEPERTTNGDNVFSDREATGVSERKEG